MAFKIDPLEDCVITLESASPPLDPVDDRARLPPAYVCDEIFELDDPPLPPAGRWPSSIWERTLPMTPAEKRDRRMEIAGIALVSVGAPMMLGGFFPLMTGLDHRDLASSNWLSDQMREDYLNKGTLQIGIGAPLLAVGGVAWISGFVILLSRPPRYK